MRFLILIFLSFFWFGCPGPSASILLTENKQSERDRWRYFETESEGVFRVRNVILADSLNLNSNDNPVIIELRNGISLNPDSSVLSHDSLHYVHNNTKSSISLSEISKIMIYDKFTANDFWVTTGNSFLTGAAVANFPATSRDSFKEAGKSALIGGSVFVVLGNLLEIRASKNTPIQIIFVSGIKEFNYSTRTGPDPE